MDWGPLFSSVKDLMLAGAGVVTAFVAVRGFTNWNRELRGRAAFDVARAMARATYALRNAVEQARVTWMDPSEFPPEGIDGAPDRANRLRHAYSNRLRPIYAAVDVFDAQTLEAEAFWGPVVKRCNRDMHRQLLLLRAAFSAIIDDAYAGGANFATNLSFRDDMRATAHGASASGDRFAEGIEAIVMRIEAIIRPHLQPVAPRSFYEWLGALL